MKTSLLRSFSLTLVLCILPIASYGEDIPPPTVEQPPPQPRPRTKPHRVKSVFVGGASFSGKTNYSVTESNGTALGTSSDTAKAYASFAGELTYQSPYLLGAGIILEGTRYNYSAGGPSDGELGIYLMPRLAQTVGRVEFWGGVGLGLMVTTIGGASSGTFDGVTVALNTTTMASFAWSPRVGIDIDVTDKIFLGAQYSYTRTTISIPFTATGGGNELAGSDNATRSWSGAALRIGSRI